MSSLTSFTVTPDGDYDDVAVQEAPKTKPVARKKSVDKGALWRKLYAYYEYERERQWANRIDMAIDEDYKDGRQWDPEDAQVLMDRGQAPLVFDRISLPVMWVTGTYRRMKADFKVIGREESDMQRSEVKTQVLKYVREVNRVPQQGCKAFDDCVTAGIGWTEEFYDPNSEQGIGSLHIPWKEVYHDSRDQSDDLSQARYWIRVKYVPFDAALSVFPDKEAALRAARIKGDDSEGWWLGERLSEPQGNTTTFGNRNGYVHSMSETSEVDDYVRLIEVRYKVYEKGRESIRFAVITPQSGGVLVDAPNPYDHGHFGVVPRYCFRRKSDNLPYGLIRKQRDVQDDYNKRRSKALWILSSNQVEMDEGAVDDIEVLREEIARPDGIIETKAGKRFALRQDKQLANEQLKLMQMDAEQMEAGMGVTDENMGRTTNAVSGVAIQGRQMQGQVVMGNVFDNAHEANQLQGRLHLSMIEQFYDHEFTIRIVGKDGNYEFIRLNYTNEEGVQSNTLIGTQADFVLAEMDQTTTARAAAANMLMDLAGKVAPTLPQAAQIMSYASLHMVDMPYREQMLSELSRIMGMRDPTKPPTPEEQAQAQQQQAAQAALAAAQTEQAMARQQADTKLIEARTQQTLAGVERTVAETIDKKMEGIYSAIQAAVQLSMAPGAAAIADSLVKSPLENPGVKPVQALLPQGLPAVPPDPSTVDQGAQAPLDRLPADADPQNPETPGVGQNAGANPSRIPQ